MLFESWQRKRADRKLGAHLVETYTTRSGGVWFYMGHAEPQEHDDLPRHRHDQKFGTPIWVPK